VHMKGVFGVSVALFPRIGNYLNSIDGHSVTCCSQQIPRFAADIDVPSYTTDSNIDRRYNTSWAHRVTSSPSHRTSDSLYVRSLERDSSGLKVSRSIT
jgi:hypothetical protein